jgi:hypothetical protein
MAGLARQNKRFAKPLVVAALFVLFASLTALAQPLPVIREPLAAWVQAQKHAPAGSLSDFETDQPRRELFQALIGAMAGQEWAVAGRLAERLRYRLAVFHEAGSSFVVASDDSGRAIDPIVIVNLRARRDVILQAPHVPYEKGTAEQAIVLLKNLGARAAIISGAHRCASRSFTMCNGVTAVCSKDGGQEAFRASDAGHNTATLFHLAHVVFTEKWKNAVAISLHGMSHDRDGIVTSFIISNGIQADDAERSTPATRLRFALAQTIAKPGWVVSCNVRSDSRYDYRPLCGFTNVQGRHINGDADACRIGVTRGTGRFIHIEQDRSVLEPYFEDWARIHRYPVPLALSRALSAVLPAIRDR